MKSNLKQFRKEAGMTMQELADKAGIVQSQISKLEKDNCNATLKTGLLIAKALNKDIFEIWVED